MHAPIAKRVPHVLDRHAGPVEDPYHWLRDRDDPDTLAYLEAENAYADEWLERLSALRTTIFNEIKTRTKETDLSVPVRRGTWEYFTRTTEGLAYPIHCRRPAGAVDEKASGAAGSDAGDVIVDENVEAGESDYFALGTLEISPNQHLAAWSRDHDGSERYELLVRDLRTSTDLADRITNVGAGGAWGDDETLFYPRLDASMRPYQVWRHRLGNDPSSDVLVYEERDERFWVAVDRTRSDAFVVITSASKITSEVHLIPTSDAGSAPIVVAPRRENHEYSVDHWTDRLVILTNSDAEDFKVMTAPIGDPGEANWRELVAHQAGRRIIDVEPFAHHLVLHEWMDGTPRLRLLFADGRERVFTFDTVSHDVEPNANLEYDTDDFRFSYQALGVPPQVLNEDVATGERKLLKETPVLGGFDRAGYVAERLWAPTTDGVRVPIDVIRHVDTAIDGTAPCVVYAYGSYEISLPTWFSIARLSLLDRGVVWALAHPRGGGELGRSWYLNGKLDHKANTFGDVIACAEYLAAKGYGAPDRLAVRGGSAGGLMVGAVVNARPELFAAAVAEVPFVDVVTTMSDPTLPLTVTEWEEWGDPRDAHFEKVMAAYSPYDNVRSVAYPAMYVSAGLNDPRVSYHEPAKWVAKLRATGTGERPILLRTEMGAGHAGPSGRYETWRDEARVIAFLLDRLGVA